MYTLRIEIQLHDYPGEWVGIKTISGVPGVPKIGDAVHLRIDDKICREMRPYDTSFSAGKHLFGIVGFAVWDWSQNDLFI